MKCKNGSFSVAKATARLTQYPGVLMVAFVTFIQGAYVILYCDDSYQTAVVGSPTHKYLWLLTRNTQATNEQLDILYRTALDNGYTQKQLDELVVTHHIG